MLKSLQSEDTYKCLGVPECEIHRDIRNLNKQLQKMVSQRTNVVWTTCVFGETQAASKLLNLIETYPPWFTQACIKLFFENKAACLLIFLKIVVDEDRLYRSNGKIMLRNDKKIFLVEMTISWISIRDVGTL